MSNLVDSVMSHLDDARVAQIAQQLGTDPASARNAIEHALPLIVGGMANQTSTPQGADSLHNALSDHAGNSVGVVLGGLLGGGGGGGLGGMLGSVLGNTANAPAGSTGGGLAMSVGGAILGHIFGGNASAANQGLGQATGLSTQNAAQLLAILAPIVMSVLANHVQQQGMTPGGLGSVLGQQGQAIQQQGGLAGSLVNAVLNHDGSSHLDLSSVLASAGGLLNAFGKR